MIAEKAAAVIGGVLAVGLAVGLRTGGATSSGVLILSLVGMSVLLVVGGRFAERSFRNVPGGLEVLVAFVVGYLVIAGATSAVMSSGERDAGVTRLLTLLCFAVGFWIWTRRGLYVQRRRKDE